MINSKMKVLFLTNVPSPYRVLFFNELGKFCDLTVLYQKDKSDERNKKWVAQSNDSYKRIYLNGISTGVDNALCIEVIKYLNKSYDVIIICGIASPTEMLAIEWCRLKKIPYFIEGDGAFVNPGFFIKEKIKRHLISGGELFLSTCREHDKYYQNYGADISKIRKYRFSSLLASDVLPSLIDSESKELLRKKLGVKEEKIVLSVGQFIYRKGFDVLLDVAVQLPKNIGVYIIGDNPTDEYLRKVSENNLTNVHFEGFKIKEELKKYYMVADAFVLPTREDIWGLVINEAMACGLPIVTTNKCNAGNQLVKDGFNGYIVNPNSIDELLIAINKTVSSGSEMRINALKTIREYTIENMAYDHIRIFEDYFLS